MNLGVGANTYLWKQVVSLHLSVILQNIDLNFEFVFNGESSIGLYNDDMGHLPGPEIKVRACPSHNNGYKNKRTAGLQLNLV